ncbi:mucin-3B-like [Octopus sinensis]|uniref:Mucin-3B-like n=1 Tax=Octopus sinensis TaxID=2607531 RepID=A0A6P7TXJ9_9MOLL|nr:mucin-3B-like [Octopus sinensis]
MYTYLLLLALVTIFGGQAARGEATNKTSNATTDDGPSNLFNPYNPSQQYPGAGYYPGAGQHPGAGPSPDSSFPILNKTHTPTTRQPPPTLTMLPIIVSKVPPSLNFRFLCPRIATTATQITSPPTNQAQVTKVTMAPKGTLHLSHSLSLSPSKNNNNSSHISHPPTTNTLITPNTPTTHTIPNTIIPIIPIITTTHTTPTIITTLITSTTKQTLTLKTPFFLPHPTPLLTS